ncbi:zinc-dependent metalloprotease, partial [Nocardia abscessus]|uniref:zinc-dependent metalloprotease n=1 Tax=Nocardia abscessus TaxID=120957 RepID=UPI002458DD0B
RRPPGGPGALPCATRGAGVVRPPLVRAGGAVGRRPTPPAGLPPRDRVWAHPDLLPDSDDLDSPAGFIDSVIGGGTTAFDDPLAQLAETEAREQAARERKDDDAGPDLGKEGDASA